MTIEKIYILVEIIHKGHLKKTVARDLPGRLSRVAYDLIMARGSDCVNATAEIVEQPESCKIDLQNQKQ